MTTDMAHIAGLVATGNHPSPVPHSDFVTTTTHKTLRGPRSGMILCTQQYAKDVDKAVFPGLQGGPLVHIIAAKAVCFKEAAEPAFADYQKQILANARTLAGAPSSGRVRPVSRGAPKPPKVRAVGFLGHPPRSRSTPAAPTRRTP